MSVIAHKRHPELVSGSILPAAQINRKQTKPDRKIMPIRVLAFDQVDLPLPVPALELLLAGDCRGHVAEHLVADEVADVVLTGKALRSAFPMLIKPREKVAGHANINRPVGLAGQDVDARLPIELHGTERAEKWTLKQVQGDDYRHGSRL